MACRDQAANRFYHWSCLNVISDASKAPVLNRWFWQCWGMVLWALWQHRDFLAVIQPKCKRKTDKAFYLETHRIWDKSIDTPENEKKIRMQIMQSNYHIKTCESLFNFPCEVDSPQFKSGPLTFVVIRNLIRAIHCILFTSFGKFEIQACWVFTEFQVFNWQEECWYLLRKLLSLISLTAKNQEFDHN